MLAAVKTQNKYCATCSRFEILFPVSRAVKAQITVVPTYIHHRTGTRQNHIIRLKFHNFKYWLYIILQ